MKLKGLHASIGRSVEYMGYAIYFRKYEDNKRFKPKKIDIEWVECQEHEGSSPMVLDDIFMYTSLDNESNLAGKVEAQKEEISFLRQELSKALAR